MFSILRCLVCKTDISDVYLLDITEIILSCALVNIEFVLSVGVSNYSISVVTSKVVNFTTSYTGV